MNKEYTTIDGDAAFTKLTADLAFGEGNSITAEGRNATFQTISGTGGLRLGAEFLNKFFPGPKKVWLVPWKDSHAL